MVDFRRPGHIYSLKLCRIYKEQALINIASYIPVGIKLNLIFIAHNCIYVAIYVVLNLCKHGSTGLVQIITCRTILLHLVYDFDISYISLQE